ncbi:hypothetical protein [Emticicia sp. W12TSBA100-4]|uniref:hypothetical protein n=1 Tax=Emticicia sp. W12TSBA100-4 TaxID=3160965 RepID=UPI0033058B9C
MTKDLLIELYRQQDRRRKRVLYDLFSDTIQINASLHFIAQMINKELGVEGLITQDDIKYCRHYFKDTKIQVKARLPEIPKRHPIPDKKNETSRSDGHSKEINWTNPDEVNLNQVIKSKFSK